jgi:hypothetical protein
MLKFEGLRGRLRTETVKQRRIGSQPNVRSYAFQALPKRRKPMSDRLVQVAAALSLLILLTSPSAIAETFNFADCDWGISREQTKKLLGSRGFGEFEVDRDGDLVFSGGRLVGHAAGGVALFTPKGRLTKMIVILATADHKAIPTYKEMLVTLKNKYGGPTHEFRSFDKPYYEGDGFEEQAVRLGKADFSAYWIGGEGKYKGTLSVKVTENLAVTITYESPEWPVESDRRQAKATDVF